MRTRVMAKNVRMRIRCERAKRAASPAIRTITPAIAEYDLSPVGGSTLFDGAGLKLSGPLADIAACLEVLLPFEDITA